MSDETFEARRMYCPECGEDYSLAYSEETDDVIVVCDCGSGEPVGSFLARFFEDRDSDGGSETPSDDTPKRGFQ